MATIKVCPHCGSNQLMAYIKRSCLVETNGVDAEGNVTFNIIKQNPKDRIEVVCCVECKRPVTNEELVEGVQCKNCGAFVSSPDELDENGNCEVCAMTLANPALLQASQSDLLRLLAQAMKGKSPKANIVDKKEAQVEQVAESIVKKEEASAADVVLNGGTPEDVPQTKGRKKRKQDVSNEEPKPADIIEEHANHVEEAMAQIAGEQQAPFPDVKGIPTGMFPPDTPSDTQPAESGFQMYSGDDDEPF